MSFITRCRALAVGAAAACLCAGTAVKMISMEETTNEDS